MNTGNPVFQGSYRFRIGGVFAQPTCRFFAEQGMVILWSGELSYFPYIHKYLHPTRQIRIGHPMGQGLRHRLHFWPRLNLGRLFSAHAWWRCVCKIRLYEYVWDFDLQWYSKLFSFRWRELGTTGQKINRMYFDTQKLLFRSFWCYWCVFVLQIVLGYYCDDSITVGISIFK